MENFAIRRRSPEELARIAKVRKHLTWSTCGVVQNQRWCCRWCRRAYALPWVGRVESANNGYMWIQYQNAYPYYTTFLFSARGDVHRMIYCTFCHHSSFAPVRRSFQRYPVAFLPRSCRPQYTGEAAESAGAPRCSARYLFCVSGMAGSPRRGERRVYHTTTYIVRKYRRVCCVVCVPFPLQIDGELATVGSAVSVEETLFPYEIVGTPCGYASTQLFFPRTVDKAGVTSSSQSKQVNGKHR